MALAETKATVSKREEIIGIAARLFYDNGYGATGIQKIINEAGIAKGTFYSHFKSKEEIGVAWLKRRHEEWNAWLESAIEGSISPKDKILAMFDFLESWLAHSDFRGCAFLNTAAETPDGNAPMRRETASHKRALLERFQDLTVHALEPRIEDEPAARDLGATLFLLFEGALVESQNFRQTWPAQLAKNQARQLLNPTPAP